MINRIQRKTLLRVLVTFLLCSIINFYSQATIYTVNSNSDANTGAGTSGTLRWCLNQVNGDFASPHRIEFNIPGGGVQSILLTSVLPTLTRSDVTIDGYTQPGAVKGPFSSRVLTLQINANNIAYPLTITASNILFRGFNLIGTNAGGVAFLSIGVKFGTAAQNTFSNVKIQGNYINVTPTGDAITPTPVAGVGGAFHAFGNIVAGVSTLHHIVYGVDGDGINDDQEGNLAACATTVSSLYTLRDVDDCIIAGNWAGLKPNGTSIVNYLPGGNTGSTTNYPVYLGNCVNCVVGTNGDGVSDDLERNVISDGLSAILVVYNYTSGVNPSVSGQALRAPGNNVVAGNYVGTFAGGNSSTNRLFSSGILIRGIGNYIGCTKTEFTNTNLRNIVCCPTNSVCIYETPYNASPWNSVSNVIKGNYIGIGANGTSALTGGWGIVHYNAVNSKSVGNVIGNMSTVGIYVGKNAASAVNNNGLLIADNLIGVQADGVSAAPISNNNIEIANGENFLITHNTISNSITRGGIGVLAGVNAGLKTQGITISENSIYNNAGLGIDLWPTTGAGVTGNDGIKSVVSSTTDPNLFLDYPVITSAVLSGTGTSLAITGYVGSLPGQTLFNGAKVEFFIANNVPANQNGPIVTGDGLNVAHGEGQTYLGTVNADANGNFTTILDVTGKGITGLTALTSTATDAAGNTSEFGPDYSNVILPVRLISFSGAYDQISKVNISWLVASEENISTYAVERSEDGHHFTIVNTVTATNGFIQHSYSSTDAAIPAAAKLYYRLRINDMDGSFTYSNTILIPVNQSNDGIELFPNPASTYMNMSFTASQTGIVKIDLLYADGRKAKRYSQPVLKGNNTIQVNELNKFFPGLYMLRLQDGNKIYYSRFVIVK